MRNSILLLLFCILFVGNLSSQSCLPDGINLTTQAQIDAFPTDYPGCTIIEDRLRVRVVNNNILTNLSGLSQITEVQGDLYLELSSSAATMVDLQDLSNITTIGGSLIILNSGSLESLNGLQNLTSIGGEITIVNNEGLLTLTGLDNVKNIGERISISSNEKLKNLTGLGGLEFLGGYLNVDVIENFVGFAPLDTIEGMNLEGSFIASTVGLESVTYIKEHLNATACPLLQNFEGLANLKKIGGSLNIERVDALNSFSMPNLEEIGSRLFLDENESLENFQGLENLKSVNELGINNNPSLINFEGLNALQSINRGANISDNNALRSFDGFDNLVRVENEFEITNNPQLESITGWDNVEITSDNFVTITQNPMLSVCNALGLCNYLTTNQPLPTNLQIFGNAVGCNSPEEILLSCNTQTCLASGINLTTQAQIDAFPTDYPSCTTIEGRLRVRVVNPNSLTNLSGLSQITEVQGDLHLELSSSGATMVDLQDLNNLTTIGGSLIILNSEGLENLNGLQNLTSIGGEITIVNNEGLQSLTGLDNLKRVEGRISIGSNQNLKNLTGLGGLEYLGGDLSVCVTENLEGFAPLDTITSINFEGCDIPSIVGLESIVHIREDLNVVACGSLTNLDGLANLKSIGGSIYIERADALTSFALPNLESIGGTLAVTESESLRNMQGLENLKWVNDLSVTDNPSFNNFEGLNSLQQYFGTINISRNPALLNFNGFESLTQLGESFVIQNNDLLSSIMGWSNVVFPGSESGIITSNPNLLICNAPGLCDYYTNASQPLPTNIEFGGNAIGCNSPEEILFSCDTEICLAADTDFTTQQEIDDFLIQNPNCKTAIANIRIFGNDITNIDGLINLDSIAGSLQMFNLPNLQNLNGFSNLRKVNGLVEISGLPLPNFIGLEKLESAEGLEFAGNSNTNFIGLNGLKRIGNSGLTIRDNENLISNIGFDNLETIEGILNYFTNSDFRNMDGFPALRAVEGEITFNEELTSISGLNALESFAGNLAFISSELSNISGFQNLRSIDGDIFLGVSSSNGLSVTGFNNLDSIGNDFNLDNFSSGILDLSGFNNLKYVGRDFRLQNILLFDNAGTLTGFNQLHTIGNEFNMENCSFITDFSNFQSLRKIKRIKIQGNSELMTLDTFANLDFQNLEYLQLEFNVDLQVCANDAICNYLSNGGFSIISNNNDGCLDKVDIEANCNTSRGKIRFASFYDVNEDGIRQPTETLYGDASVSLQPLGYTLFGNPDSLSRVLLPEDNYTLTLNTPKDWRITSGNGIQTVDLTNGNPCDTVLFGIFPEVQGGKMSTFISAPPTRCNEFIKFEVTAKNIGTTTTDGWLWLEIDGNILDVQFIDSPNTQFGDTEFGWMINGVPPGNSVTKEILLKIPGPNDFPIGQNLVFKSFVNFEDNGMTIRSDEFEYLAELRCAYDPNDKLVNPSREGNFTQFDEELIYTIRFQNTGNDVANDVTIRDFIDGNLDLSTFQILGSSHYENLSTTIENRLVTFDFSNIFLPDSTSDFEGSNGYVMFSIQSNGGLSEFTDVENQASIFFDFNPPIVTNTALNVMVSSIVDMDNDGFFEFQDCDDTNPNVNPDAIEIPDNGIDEDCDGMDLLSGVEDAFSAKFKVYPNPTSGKIFLIGDNLQTAKITVTDLTGRILLIEKLNGSNEIDLPKATKGMLFLKIETGEGVAVKRVMKF